VVALGEQEGLIRLGYREEGPWEAHDRGHDHDGHGHGHGHEKEQLDMHLWLDPVNARVMTAAITRTLSEADPERAALYRTNGEAVAARLAALDSRIAEDLAPIRARAYVVFHDAYQYFEARYGLSPAGSVTVSPERKPSAKRISEIRAKIASSGAACVFSEPQFESSLVKTVIEGSAARSRVLDPLGADLPPGANAYFTLMDRLADSLKGCLAPAS
jgi:zinc transport system substrate-binding protein